MVSQAQSHRGGELPLEAQRLLLTGYQVKNLKKYRAAIQENSVNSATDDLFAVAGASEVDYSKAYEKNLKEAPISWGTDNYSSHGRGHGFSDALKDISLIKPRTEKPKAEQRRRVREKAEVFTPAWVCNLQNNLIDGAVLGENAFNIPSADQRSWTSTPSVEFTEEYPWWKYVAERRLEMCCGEGPYLFSPYDATTGEPIPVRVFTPGEGGEDVSDWRRIGILDRKLRVVTENVEGVEDWITCAKAALRSTYGFEWQGDNLFLARVNMVNTFLDYLRDFMDNVAGEGEALTDGELEALTVDVAAIVSKQLWQMDGLRMVLPGSCSEECIACAKRRREGHDGICPAFAWGDGWRTMEEMLLLNGE